MAQTNGKDVVTLAKEARAGAVEARLRLVVDAYREADALWNRVGDPRAWAMAKTALEEFDRWEAGR